MEVVFEAGPNLDAPTSSRVSKGIRTPLSMAELRRIVPS